MEDEKRSTQLFEPARDPGVLDPNSGYTDKDYEGFYITNIVFH